MPATQKPKMNVAKWTILMQISAENNLFNDMMQVMEELYSVKNNKEVNFLVLFDGIKDPKFSNDFALPAIYKINGDTNFLLDNPALPEIEDDGEFPHFDEDLTNEENLTEIFLAVKDKYPAEKYGYIYKGHGGPGGGDVSNKVFMTKIAILDKTLLDENAPEEIADLNEEEIEKLVRKLAEDYDYNSTFSLSGFTQDNEDKAVVGVIFEKKMNEDAHFLTYKTISNVLGNVFGKKGTEFIFLDCCWGMQLENLYSFKDCTKNFIASADEMPSAGIGYDLFYRKISERPVISGTEIGDLLVAVYYVDKYNDYDSPNPDFRKMGVSLTHADTREVDLLKDLINKFCTYLIENIHDFIDILEAARVCCKDYTYVEDANVYAVYNIDFLWFLENVQFFNGKSKNDDQLDDLIKDIINHISVEIRYGFLSSNYVKPVPGKRELGGRGFTTTFPEKKSQIEKSIFNLPDEEKPDYLKDSRWEELIRKYLDLKIEVSEQTEVEIIDIQMGRPPVRSFATRKIVVLESARGLSKNGLQTEDLSKWGRVIKLAKEIR